MVQKEQRENEKEKVRKKERKEQDALKKKRKNQRKIGNKKKTWFRHQDPRLCISPFVFSWRYCSSVNPPALTNIHPISFFSHSDTQNKRMFPQAYPAHKYN